MASQISERRPILGLKSDHSNYDSIFIKEGDATSSESSDGSHMPSDDSSTSSVDTDDNNNDKSFRSWTRQQWMILLLQNCLIFASCVAYSLLSTFFPQEASEKDVSSLITGLIFGIYEFVVFCTAPIFGSLVSII